MNAAIYELALIHQAEAQAHAEQARIAKAAKARPEPARPKAAGTVTLPV